MSEQDIAAALNRIADEIRDHLAWFRKHKEEEAAARTKIPPLDYRLNPRMLNGQWPRRDGTEYGNHPETKSEA
jgi:hypothetical protein